MLALHYAPDVPGLMIDLAEHHARQLGLALDALERVGQSLDTVEAFIVAAEAGMGAEFARDLDAAPAGPLSVAAAARADAAA